MSQELKQWQARMEDCVRKELESQQEFDAAHDLSHMRRVWQHCQTIMQRDKAEVEPLVLLAAAYFHDIVNVPKQSDKRNQASRLAASRALELLQSLSYPEQHLQEVKTAIESHSYSANIEPATIAAKIIQDADRLEALGALGIARVFYIAGKMNSLLFHPEDPWAENRELDEKKYALDHFYVKILNIRNGMQTDAGSDMADELTKEMKQYLLQLRKEISNS